jgi:hypothetical protein
VLDWLGSLIGREVSVSPVSAEPDRWGRRAGRIVLIDESPPLSLAWAIVDAGLGVVDIGEDEALCDKALLADEARARAARIGLWARDDHGPIGATDAEGLKARDGRFVVVEGRIRGVGERRFRTYLNFGPPGSGALSVTIPKEVWRIFAGRGTSADVLRGRQVRLRGMIEVRRGPMIEITSADLVEVIGDRDARR